MGWVARFWIAFVVVSYSSIPSFAQPPPPLYSVNVSLDTSKVLATTGDGLVSANFDWHLDSEEYPAWVNSSVLVLDLTDKKTIYLAKQLAPGHLRVGGSEEDVAIYDIGKHLPCKTGFCMSMEKWWQLVNFSQTTGMRLVFGLDAMYGRANKSSSWDPSNSQALLEYTAQHNLPVYAFELGNELQSKVDADKMAESYHDVRKMINQLWPNQSNRPLLIGPDENPSASFLESFLPMVADAIDGVTYHLYPGYGLDKDLPDKIMQPSFLDKYRGQMKPLVDVINAKVPHAEGWIGETAAAWHSGQMNTTNAFISGFWYLGALGEAANLNQKALCRQTLIGGYYELLNKTTRDPNPDYYTALLWKRLMGVKMLNVSITRTDKLDTLRMYASCSPPNTQWSPGAVTIAYINLDRYGDVAVRSLTISGSSESLLDENRLQYDLRSSGNDARSNVMDLNNTPLKLTEDGELPDMPGEAHPAKSGLIFFMQSYGFIVFPNAKAPACMSST